MSRPKANSVPHLPSHERCALPSKRFGDPELSVAGALAWVSRARSQAGLLIIPGLTVMLPEDPDPWGLIAPLGESFPQWRGQVASAPACPWRDTLVSTPVFRLRLSGRSGHAMPACHASCLPAGCGPRGHTVAAPFARVSWQTFVSVSSGLSARRGRPCASVATPPGGLCGPWRSSVTLLVPVSRARRALWPSMLLTCPCAPHSLLGFCPHCLFGPAPGDKTAAPARAHGAFLSAAPWCGPLATGSA